MGNGLPWGTAALAAFVAAVSYSVIRMVQERRFYRNLPKPPHHWFWGHLKLMGEIMASLPKDCHYQVAVTTIARKYDMPGVWYLDLWPASCGQVIVVDPDVALHMTVTKNHPKHDAEKLFVDPLIGVGNIVTTEGAEWKYLHKMLTPAFSIQHVTNMRPAIAEELMEFRSLLRAKAETGEKFRLEDLTLRTTFDVIGKATFAHSMNAKSKGSDALVHWEAMTRAFMRTRDSWNFVQSFFKKREIDSEARKLTTILTELVKRRFDVVMREKADLSSKKRLCIMDLILREYVGEGKQELDQAFIDTAMVQVKTLLIAGMGTTSDVLCFTYMLLSVHPEVVQKLRQEHDAIFTPGVDASYKLLQSDPYKLNQLEYTTNVIKEVLRFYPIGNTARAEHPVEKSLFYNGRAYPTNGKMVCPVQLVMHMNADIFANPKKFDPDRFAREDFPRHAWRPFERGPRACLGQPLAMDEVKIALLLTVRDFDFVCADVKPNKSPRVEWTDWDLTFGDLAFQEFVFEARPRDGIPMTVKMAGWKG